MTIKSQKKLQSILKRRIFFWVFVLIVSKASFAQPGNILFSDASLHEIRFDNIDTTTFFSYANKGVYAQAKITIDGTIIDSIGVTTKGNISWYHINNKKPLKIDLNKYVSGKKYDGIKKFYLHNSYEDPSLMREKLTYDICDQLGLHALRTAFVKVYVNNLYWGLYTLVESKDELYKRDFQNKNAEVFETLDFGGPCIFNQTVPYWQVDNGNPLPTWPNLHKLTDILNNTPTSQYADTVPKYFNITDFYKYQALNTYLLNFDSYLQFNGNQLYLYDTITNKFQIIPWDFNASFGLWNTGQFNPGNLDAIPPYIINKCPFDKINTIPSYYDTYLEAICLLKNTICDTTLFNTKITTFYNQIKSAAHADIRKQPTNTEFDKSINYGYQAFNNDNVPALKTFINERWVKINNDLLSISYSCDLTNNAVNLNNEVEIALYPNPVEKVLNLSFQEGPHHIIITNTIGQIVLETSIDNASVYSIDVENIQPGIYFVTILNHLKQYQIAKFVKK